LNAATIAFNNALNGRFQQWRRDPGERSFMRTSLIEFIQRWVVTTLAVLVAVKVVHGLDCFSPSALVITSLLLGLLNATLKPLLIVISAPLAFLNVGLFIIAIPVINALLLLMAGWLVKGFAVKSFGAAFWGALVISIVSLITNAIIGRNSKITIRRSGKGKGDGTPGPGPGSGPVIDV
jgi:putative membrane protein